MNDEIFREGESYSIKFEYTGDISPENTGVYSAVDPDFLRDNEHKLDGLKNLGQLSQIEDQELKSLILENSIFCTTLAPAEARTLMPCLDEPRFKAVFKLSVKVNHKSHIAISNTPV